MGGAGDDIAYAVALAPDGSAAYVVGAFSSYAGTFGAPGSKLYSRGGYDGFAAKARGPRSTPPPG